MRRGGDEPDVNVVEISNGHFDIVSVIEIKMNLWMDSGNFARIFNNS